MGPWPPATALSPLTLPVAGPPGSAQDHLRCHQAKVRSQMCPLLSPRLFLRLDIVCDFQRMRIAQLLKLNYYPAGPCKSKVVIKKIIQIQFKLVSRFTFFAMIT